MAEQASSASEGLVAYNMPEHYVVQYLKDRYITSFVLDQFLEQEFGKVWYRDVSGAAY